MSEESTNVSRDDSNTSNDLSTDLLDIRLERELKRVLRYPDASLFLKKHDFKISKSLTLVDKTRVLMRKVSDMDVSMKLELYRDVKFAQAQFDRERLVWHTYELSGIEPVDSPRGRRKIALRIEEQLHGSVVAMCDRFEEAVWVVLFNRRALNQMATARRSVATTPTVFVWYSGEHALYTNRATCQPNIVSAVCTTLGYCTARRVRLSGRRLSTMRLMHTAKADGRYNSRHALVDDYPLPF